MFLFTPEQRFDFRVLLSKQPNKTGNVKKGCFYGHDFFVHVFLEVSMT